MWYGVVDGPAGTVQQDTLTDGKHEDTTGQRETVLADSDDLPDGIHPV